MVARPVHGPQIVPEMVRFCLALPDLNDDFTYAKACRTGRRVPRPIRCFYSVFILVLI